MVGSALLEAQRIVGRACSVPRWLQIDHGRSTAMRPLTGRAVRDEAEGDHRGRADEEWVCR